MRPIGLALLALVSLGTESATAEEVRPERIRWSELHFEASKLGFSIEAQLRLERLASAALDEELVDPAPGGWLSAPTEGGFRLDLATRGLGKTSELALLVDRSGRSLQRVQRETGRRAKENRVRTHRFGDGSVHVRTRRPTGDELEKPAAAWSDTTDWVPDLPSGLRPGQSTGLFYLLAAAPLTEPGDHLRTHLFLKTAVSRVDLTVEGREAIEVDHVLVRGRASSRRRETRTAIKIRIDGRRLGNAEGASDFRFLGLKGKVYAYVDEETRAPLLITGRIGWLGRAKVQLTRLVLPAP